MHKPKNFFQRLLEPYQIVLFKKSMEERVSFKVNIFRILVFVFLIVGLLFLFIFLGIQYTPLKKYINGFQSNETRRKIMRVFQQVDSLNNHSKMLEQYIAQMSAAFSKDIQVLQRPKPNIIPLQNLYEKTETPLLKANIKTEKLRKTIKILERQLKIKEAEVAELSRAINSKDTIINIAEIDQNLDSILAKELESSPQDMAFRNEIDRQSNFNLLSFEKMNEPLIFFPPAKGKVTATYTPQKKWESIIRPDRPFIKSILSGRVVLITQTLENETVLIITHGQNYTSVYKNVTVNNLQEGDWVEHGAVIAKTFAKKNGYFGFQLWKDGYAIDPRKWMNFRP